MRPTAFTASGQIAVELIAPGTAGRMAHFNSDRSQILEATDVT